MEKVIDPIWEKIHSSRKWGMYPPEHIIRFIARNYYNKDRGKIKILDFGCGQGANTWYLAREGFDTYAFDGSESACKKSLAYLASDNLCADVKVMDALNIDYEDSYFDAVVDNACICCNKIGDIKQMYNNIYRVLKKGGKIITVCFGGDLYGYKSGKEIEPSTYCDITEGLLANLGVLHIFSDSELKEILSNTGFKDIQCDWCRYSDNGRLVHNLICTAVK